jgi:hypothetical protein
MIPDGAPMSNAAHFILTPVILKAMRASRAIVVSSRLDGDCNVVDGSANVRIEVGDYDSPEKHTSQFDTYGRVRTYAEKGISEFRHGALSAVMSNYPSQVTTLGSILDMLKVGDELGIEYNIGSSSPAMDEVNFVEDSIHLLVRRTTPKGTVTDFRFLMERVLTTSNSSARIIRYAC